MTVGKTTVGEMTVVEMTFSPKSWTLVKRGIRGKWGGIKSIKLISKNVYQKYYVNY